jgi:hypothetical protein
MDHTGKKYGHLTLVSKIRPGGHGVGAVWKAVCDCGRDREVLAKDVVAGRVRSCGKCNYSKILRTSSSTRNILQNKQLKKGYERLVRNCLTRRVACTISYEEYCRILTLDCTYCGNSASEGVPKVGLVSNEAGFTPTNCIPSCTNCKKLQGDYNSSEFLKLVMKIANRINTLQSIE